MAEGITIPTPPSQLPSSLDPFFIGMVPIFPQKPIPQDTPVFVDGQKPSYADLLKVKQITQHQHVVKGTIAASNVNQIGYVGESEVVSIRPPSSFQGKPAVVFTIEDKNHFLGNLNHTLVGKFSHGRPSLPSIKVFFANLKLQGNYNLSLLDNKHLAIECECKSDFIKLWLELTWYIKGLPMRMFKWESNFSLAKESSIAPVWVTFVGVPIYMFEQKALLSISNAIGTPIRIDPMNVTRVKLSSARVCVELDVSKPLFDSIWVCFEDAISKEVSEGFWVKVVYETVPSFCESCSHIGHGMEVCKRRNKDGSCVAQSQFGLGFPIGQSKGDDSGHTVKVVHVLPQLKNQVGHMTADRDKDASSGSQNAVPRERAPQPDAAKLLKGATQFQFEQGAAIQTSEQGVQEDGADSSTANQQPSLAGKLKFDCNGKGMEQIYGMLAYSLGLGQATCSSPAAAPESAAIGEEEKAGDTSATQSAENPGHIVPLNRQIEGSSADRFAQSCSAKPPQKSGVKPVAEAGTIHVTKTAIEPTGNPAAATRNAAGLGLNDGSASGYRLPAGAVYAMVTAADAGIEPDVEADGEPATGAFVVVDATVKTATVDGADLLTTKNSFAVLNEGVIIEELALEEGEIAEEHASIKPVVNAPGCLSAGDAIEAALLHSQGKIGEDGAVISAVAAREGCWADLVEQDHEQQLARPSQQQVEELTERINRLRGKEPDRRAVRLPEKDDYAKKEMKIGEAERVRKSTAQEEKQLARELKFVRERKNLKEYFMASAEKINSDLKRNRSEKKEKTTGTSLKYGEG